MMRSLIAITDQVEITDLLANWADTPASGHCSNVGHCFHCYRFAPGAEKGVPCYDCRDDVQYEADVQAWRDEEAEAEYWRNLPVGGHD